MARLLPEEGERAYLDGRPSLSLVMYDPEEHQEEMHEMATGLIGALLRLKLPSISGPQIGSRIPIVVINVPGDLLRIFVDPFIEPYGELVDCNLPRMKKARQHVELTALSYKGEPIYFTTMECVGDTGEEVAAWLQWHDNKFSTLRRELATSQS